MGFDGGAENVMGGEKEERREGMGGSPKSYAPPVVGSFAHSRVLLCHTFIYRMR